MKRFKQQVCRFFGDEHGPTATEYAVLLALITMVAIAALSTFGDSVMGLYDAIYGAVA